MGLSASIAGPGTGLLLLSKPRSGAGSVSRLSKMGCAGERGPGEGWDM